MASTKRPSCTYWGRISIDNQIARPVRRFSEGAIAPSEPPGDHSGRGHSGGGAPAGAENAPAASASPARAWVRLGVPTERREFSNRVFIHPQSCLLILMRKE